MDATFSNDKIIYTLYYKCTQTYHSKTKHEVLKCDFGWKLESHVLFGVRNYKDLFFNVQWTFCHWNVDHVSCCLNGCKNCQYCISR
jgi:hypothetical protein